MKLTNFKNRLESYICPKVDYLQISGENEVSTFDLTNPTLNSFLTTKLRDMKLAKKLLILLVIMFGLNVFISNAQTADTVCAGTTGKTYWVTAKTGSTYNWTVNGGTQASGGNTNSITIDFNTSTGVDTIYVQETDSNGCIADPVALAIVRMPLPTASISGATTLCHNDSAQITVSLTGTYPLSLTYSDGSGNITVNNISSSTYQFNTGILPSTTTYSLVSVEDVLTCSSTPSGSAVVTVLPKPTTSQIFH